MTRGNLVFMYVSLQVQQELAQDLLSDGQLALARDFDSRAIINLELRLSSRLFQDTFLKYVLSESPYLMTPQ